MENFHLKLRSLQPLLADALRPLVPKREDSDSQEVIRQLSLTISAFTAVVLPNSFRICSYAKTGGGGGNRGTIRAHP